jgi:hypothetical protein
MGLTSGEHGVKRFVESAFPTAVARFFDLYSFTCALELEPAQVAAVRDGNIMMMGMPTSIKKFEDMVQFAVNSISLSMRHANYVCVCFDNPQRVPIAKVETQSKRDGDRPPISTPPNWSLELLHATEDCRPFVQQRSLRYALFDSIMTEAMRMLALKFSDCEGSICLIDGIDFNGARRHPDASRNPSAQCTSMAKIDRFGVHVNMDGLVRETSEVGEADLKLSVYARCMRRAASEHREFSCIVLDTVDTDILPISMLMLVHETIEDNQSNQANPISTLGIGGASACVAPRLFIGMRERGTYAAKELMKAHGHEIPSNAAELKGAAAGWMFVDAEELMRSIMRHLHPTAFDNIHMRVAFVRALCTSWAVTGCDFVPCNVPASDSLTECVLQTFRAFSEEHRADYFAFWNAHTTDTDVPRMVSVIRAICRATAQRIARRKSAANALVNVSESNVRRALWTMIYWSVPGQHRHNMAFYGFPTE